MDNRIIKRNALKCKLCGDIIESKSTHDLVWCKCGKCYIDGGKDYVRYGAEKRDDVLLLTEYENPSNKCET